MRIVLSVSCPQSAFLAMPIGEVQLVDRALYTKRSWISWMPGKVYITTNSSFDSSGRSHMLILSSMDI